MTDHKITLRSDELMTLCNAVTRDAGAMAALGAYREAEKSYRVAAILYAYSGAKHFAADLAEMAVRCGVAGGGNA